MYIADQRTLRVHIIYARFTFKKHILQPPRRVILVLSTYITGHAAHECIRICFTAKCDSAHAHETQGVVRLQGLKLGSGTIFRACVLSILLQLSLLNATHGISSGINDGGKVLEVHNYTCNSYIELVRT